MKRPPAKRRRPAMRSQTVTGSRLPVERLLLVIGALLFATACQSRPGDQRTTEPNLLTPEQAKEAIIALIRSDHSLFAGNPDPDRFQTMTPIKHEDEIFGLGAFRFDLKKGMYYADIVYPLSAWFYTGNFSLSDGRWVANRPSVQHMSAPLPSPSSPP
jgi:hypothetical protein